MKGHGSTQCKFVACSGSASTLAYSLHVNNCIYACRHKTSYVEVRMWYVVCCVQNWGLIYIYIYIYILLARENYHNI